MGLLSVCELLVELVLPKATQPDQVSSCIDGIVCFYLLLINIYLLFVFDTLDHRNNSFNSQKIANSSSNLVRSLKVTHVNDRTNRICHMRIRFMSFCHIIQHSLPHKRGSYIITVKYSLEILSHLVSKISS